MFRLITIAAISFWAAGAGAVPISSGALFQGTFTALTDDATPAGCCPVISFDGPINSQQINFVTDTGSETRLNFGETLTFKVFDSGLNLLGESTVESRSTTGMVGGGVGLPRFELTSGFVQISTSDDLVVLTGLELQSSVYATVEAIGGGTLATQLPVFTEVENITRIATDPPVDGVVPLPATALSLLAGLAALGGLRRRPLNS